MAAEKANENGRNRAMAALPIVLTAAVYLFMASGGAVIDYDEGYYAEAAKGVVTRGDWVTPYVNGVKFLEKPPLLYWVTAASFTIFGISEFALRLPTGLAVIALVWVVMRIARRCAGDRAAWIAGLSAAFSAGTCLFTRETLHDVWLVLFIALALYAFTEWYLDPSHPARHAMLFYAAAAGAAMCKSLVGVVFPVAIVTVFLLISRGRPKWRNLHILPGSLLFFGLTVPWHWLAAVRNPGFLEFFFIGEQFLRFLGSREPPVLWSVPLPVFWALLPVWFFPWTAFVPAALAEARKCADKYRQVLVRLAAVWAGVILVFFSLSDRLEHYAFPALPALSLLVAAILGKEHQSKWITWAFRGLAVFGILAVAIAAGAAIWLAAGPGIQSDALGPTDRLSETDFSILAEMPPAVLVELMKPALIAAMAMAAGFWAALRLESRRRRTAAVMSMAAVMIAVCGMIHWSLNICEDLISSKKFGVAVARQARPGDRLVVVGDYESANSLSFYQPLRVEVVEGTAYALIPGMAYPDAPKIVLTLREFQAVWQSESRVFALVPAARAAELKMEGTEIIRALHRVLMRNR